MVYRLALRPSTISRLLYTRGLTSTARSFSSSSATPERRTAVGLIGLGQMGQGMAKNLAEKATGAVYIHDVNEAAVQRLVKAYPHLKAVSSPAEMAEKASTVLTMLPEASHVERVYEALGDTVDSESVLVDSSTIDAQVAEKVAAKIMKHAGVLAFDAPVSGGTRGAELGTLTFMVGAPSMEGFNKVKPTLEWMGKNVVYCGANGAGQVAKLCNNMLLGIHMIGVSEAMLLGTRLGMDPQLLASIINTSTGNCWSSNTNNPHPGVIPTAPSSREYQGGFSNKLMAKDLRLAMKAAQDAATHPEMGTMAAKVFDRLSTTEQYGSLDFSSVYKWMKSVEKSSQ